MQRFLSGAPRQMMRLTLVRRRRLSPHLVRATIGGQELAGFVPLGGDQCFRLFFPRTGQTILRMPTLANNGWMAQYFLMSSSTRPHVRSYTVRAFRPEALELDVDFVVHGDGPASTWVQNAEPGSPVGLFDEGRMYQLREGAAWQLLVADESGLPAALAIAEETPTTVPTRLIVEVPSNDDAFDTELGEHVRVTWLPRRTTSVQPGHRALETTVAAPVPPGAGSVFVAGENALATGVRRGLVAAGVPKTAISFFGYWKHGRAAIG
ncbi:MAG TPA: siderophore-interacting protein [Cellulomonas sp.]